MQRIITDTGLFQSGDPTRGIPGTIVTAKWLNDIQEELCSILVAAGMDPDGTSQDQLLQALRATFFDNRTGAPILYVQTTPSNKIADIIYVIDRACFMRWQTIGSWTGYASDQIGALIAGTTKTPRANEIDAIGQTVSKSRYPGLWAFAQHNDLVVPSSSWRAGTYYFTDLGGDNFRVPDERNMFIRFTGTDLDSANALGSYGQDQIQNITGALAGIGLRGYENIPSGWHDGHGAFSKSSIADTGWISSQVTSSTNGARLSEYVIRANNYTLNTSRVVRTGDKTMPERTHLAGRIIVF